VGWPTASCCTRCCSGTTWVSAQVSNETLLGLQANVFWDGVFHLVVTALVVVGVLMLWRAWERPQHSTGNTSVLLGLVLLGWGAFHAVDQVVFHEILNLHDTSDDAANPGLYNWGFFAVGLLLAGAGWVLWRRKGRLGAAQLDTRRSRSSRDDARRRR
jgi:uncharacterized membrane protein